MRQRLVLLGLAGLAHVGFVAAARAVAAAPTHDPVAVALLGGHAGAGLLAWLLLPLLLPGDERTRRRRAARVDRLLPGWLSRGIASIALSAATLPAVGGVAAAMPAAASPADEDPAAESAAAPPPPPVPPIPLTPPDIAPAPEVAAATAADTAADTAAHTVAPGENLWVIARGALLQARPDGPVGDRDVHAYWVRVLQANADRLPSGDVDLIHPGDVVRLPSLP